MGPFHFPSRKRRNSFLTLQHLTGNDSDMREQRIVISLPPLSVSKNQWRCKYGNWMTVTTLGNVWKTHLRMFPPRAEHCSTIGGLLSLWALSLHSTLCATSNTQEGRSLCKGRKDLHFNFWTNGVCASAENISEAEKTVNFVFRTFRTEHWTHTSHHWKTY